jgi:hypothetical protein
MLFSSQITKKYSLCRPLPGFSMELRCLLTSMGKKGMLDTGIRGFVLHRVLGLISAAHACRRATGAAQQRGHKLSAADIIYSCGVLCERVSERDKKANVK